MCDSDTMRHRALRLSWRVCSSNVCSLSSSSFILSDREENSSTITESTDPLCYFSAVSKLSLLSDLASPIMASLHSHSSSLHLLSIATISGLKKGCGESEQAHFRLFDSFKQIPALRIRASREPLRMTNKLTESIESETEKGQDLFNEIKHRFLSFKKQKYLESLEHFQNLAKAQAPKFLVIACADSRVCPTSILGFQPGEAFMVRNVANLVPRFENGPSETNAALEFAVNSLEVENILIIGHSCCGGIRALMSMQDEADSSSLIGSWVVVGKNAKIKTKASASSLSFDQQCRHCEKESINHSLSNLLTYPWIEERVKKGVLSVHGGYYDFIDCTFEKWTLDYKRSSFKDENGGCSFKDQLFWS